MERNGATLSDFLAVGKEIEVECVAHIIVGNETDQNRKRRAKKQEMNVTYKKR